MNLETVRSKEESVGNHEKGEDGMNHIRVAVRVRPMNAREKKDQSSCCEIIDLSESKKGTKKDSNEETKTNAVVRKKTKKILKIECRNRGGSGRYVQGYRRHRARVGVVESSNARELVHVTPRDRARSSRMSGRTPRRSVSTRRHRTPISRIQSSNGVSTPGDNKPRYKKFAFDRLFGPQDDNETIFRDVVKAGVDNFLRGVNATVMAYGQTSSGKTFTMTGTKSCPGVVPLATQAVFEHVKNNSDAYDFFLRVTMCEVYNEQVRDLMVSKRRQKKTLRVQSNGEVHGLKETIVKDPLEVFKLIEKGQTNRTSGDTKLNSVSSRSHSIFRLHLESRPTTRESDTEADRHDDDDDFHDDEDVTVSVLTLVDLAGSERAKETGARGKRFEEGNNINKSLMTLRRVIKVLNQQGKNKSYVPFRDSLLTKILQPSLGGNARTVVICNITPAAAFRNDTESTLEFAKDVSQITNHVRVNRIKARDAGMKSHAKAVQQLRQNLKHGGTSMNMSPEAIARRDKRVSEVSELAEAAAAERKKKKGLIHQVVRLGSMLFPGSGSKKRRSGDKSGNVSYLKKRRMSAPVASDHQTTLLDALNAVADDDVDASRSSSSGDGSLRSMQVNQLKRRVVELTEDLEEAERSNQESLAMLQEMEDRASSRIGHYEKQNAILSGENISTLTEVEIQEHEKMHLAALLNLQKARVESEYKAEIKRLHEQISAFRERFQTMEIDRETLTKRLESAEARLADTKEDNERLKSLNLKLELKLKSLDHHTRRGSSSCQKATPDVADAKENARLSTNAQRQPTFASPTSATKRTTLHQLFDEGAKKYNNH